MTSQTYHCNALMIDGTGIVIKGPSGSGKSSLTMGLLERARHAGAEAHFVSDDRTLLNKEEGILTAQAPDTIRGKIELRGHGIMDFPYLEKSMVHLIVWLVNDTDLERMPAPKTTVIEDIELPLIEVPCRHEQASVRIVFAWLKAHSNAGLSLAL
ncbi:MAG: HPr kinase/phosphatase C-terminal domain-containing protein [Pseudomonadota bacterium]